MLPLYFCIAFVYAKTLNANVWHKVHSINTTQRRLAGHKLLQQDHNSLQKTVSTPDGA